MALYKAQKNIYFTSLNKDVALGEIIELEQTHAEAVNADLKPVFTDVDAVLVPVDEDTKPKKAARNSKSDTEAVKDAADT